MGFALAVLFALFVWWFSTGVVLYIVGLPRRTYGWSMLAATGVLAFALAGVAATANDASAAGAYCAFTCALLVWAWHEMAFLTGYVTGPRPERCPPGSTGWKRFSYASQTLLYHELGILLTAVALFALTYGAPNQIGVWTFLLLWLMRLSAKLNVFFGVPNLSEEFLPDGLGFLKSYFAKRPMNLFFPVSITVSTIVTVLLVQPALGPDATEFEIAGFTLVATLMALAVLEHWLLVLPLPAAALWGWGLKSRALDATAQAPATTKIWIKDEARLLGPSGR